MTYKIYSIRDKVHGFGAPFLEQSEQSALRGFSYAVNTRDGMMNYVPSDFDLYEIGSFDMESGAIAPISPVVLIQNGGAVRAP